VHFGAVRSRRSGTLDATLRRRRTDHY
jgi:hypothetical protein